MKTMKFGIIGCGLMGREFASATLRWVHLKDEITKPEIIGVCDMNPASFEWFDKAFPNLKYHFTDYHDLLACEDIEAVYCAVPHVLHQQVYSDIINAGKHLMGKSRSAWTKHRTMRFWKPSKIIRRSSAAAPASSRSSPPARR